MSAPPDTETSAMMVATRCRSKHVRVQAQVCGCGEHWDVKVFWLDARGTAHALRFDLELEGSSLPVRMATVLNTVFPRTK